MDVSQSDSDVSISPTQLLERLQMLRQLQHLQRGKLQKQCLQYQEQSSASSFNVTDILESIASSTSYKTFQSLLQQSAEPNSPNRSANFTASKQIEDKDLIDGVSVLNVSQESECIIKSPTSSHSNTTSVQINSMQTIQNKLDNQFIREPKAIDEIPILSPKQDFETLLLQKLKNEKAFLKNDCSETNQPGPQFGKKTFLRKGEGMARIGLDKKALVIQNTNSLPWKKGNKNCKFKQTISKPKPKAPVKENKNLHLDNINVQIIVPEFQKHQKKPDKTSEKVSFKLSPQREEPVESSENCEVHSKVLFKKPEPVKLSKAANKSKTWAAILNTEQEQFLRQLKQSSYYKNFVSPAKSQSSDISCDETHSTLVQERETAEQNVFELIEQKVSGSSFSLENSFFNKFLRKSNLECSGESTPLVFQKCLEYNPNLLHIYPGPKNSSANTQHTQSDGESEGTDCDHESCSSASTCCSCKTVEESKMSCSCQSSPKTQKVSNKKETNQKVQRKKVQSNEKHVIPNKQNVTETDVIKSDMAEMNAKLIATSELLKERLKELESEIETFRKENVTLTKMREEIDLERQKFYEDKASFEQKFNEEKILSEYYIAEEKEKLNKQKLMYERYVKEMRGRLNKKDRDEVVNLKKELADLKEEVRLKDAKSTTHIARLRNQLKIAEKEKTNLQAEIEKLKKENRRIQHSNDVTRRLSNIKYLEQINKKLSDNMNNKEVHSAIDFDRDIKYKAFEIERQSRGRKMKCNDKGPRPRAKSVPNLNVTSRYAKYFSQRDVTSQLDKMRDINIERFDSVEDVSNKSLDSYESLCLQERDSDYENNLEKLYREQFGPSQGRNNAEENDKSPHSDVYDHGFFIKKQHLKSVSGSQETINTRRSKSPFTTSSSTSKSPVTCMQNMNDRTNSTTNWEQIKGSSHFEEANKWKPSVNKEYHQTSGTASSKSSLNLTPTEIKKSDGTRELRYPNGNVKLVSPDGQYTKFIYYNGDVKENFYDDGRVKYFYAETKTYHTTYADGLQVLEFADGQVEKRYKDGSTEVRLPNGSVRYHDPKNTHVQEEWRFPDGSTLTVAANGEKRVVFANGQIEVHAKDHKRREYPDGTVKLLYNDGTSETRYSSGRVRVKDKHGNLIMDSASKS